MRTTTTNLAEYIVDIALEIADKSSWESVRLYQIAEKLDISIEKIHEHYHEKEDLVDAWFDRADKAMLNMAGTTDFQQQNTTEKLHALIMMWLNTLAAHHSTTRQMILGKFEPGHIHYQLSGLFRISRTVQWIREAAGRNSTLPGRAIEETALTALYLTCFFYWIFNGSKDDQATSKFLANKLKLFNILNTGNTSN